MGFRSTFVTEDKRVIWPQWFKDKYKNVVWFPKVSGVISSKRELKLYDTFTGPDWYSLVEDIQKSIDWTDGFDMFRLVFLHECGGITRCQIEKDGIKWSEPAEWWRIQQSTHDYCYGCSDVK